MKHHYEELYSKALPLIDRDSARNLHEMIVDGSMYEDYEIVECAERVAKLVESGTKFDFILTGAIEGVDLEAMEGWTRHYLIETL